MEKHDWILLIIEKKEKKLVSNYIVNSGIVPKNFKWTSQDLGEKHCSMRFRGKEELITKLSFCLSNYKDSRKYLGEFLMIDKEGDF